MMNLYLYYNKPGLDNEHYKPLITRANAGSCTPDLIAIEHIIKDDCPTAYHYARYVIRRRFVKAEPYIVKSTYFARVYAVYVMKERWLEAEDVIKKDDWSWDLYKQSFNF